MEYSLILVYVLESNIRPAFFSSQLNSSKLLEFNWMIDSFSIVYQAIEYYLGVEQVGTCERVWPAVLAAGFARKTRVNRHII